MDKTKWQGIPQSMAEFLLRHLLIFKDFILHVPQNLKAFFSRRWVKVTLLVTACLLLVFIGLLMTGRQMATKTWQQWAANLKSTLKPSDDVLAKGIDKYMKTQKKAYLAQAPKGVFIVIDTAQNKLTVRKDGEIIQEALVSCGSGNILEEPGGKRTWIFDTPHGEFEVKYKLRDPVWIKPDWSFIEEGIAIPKSQQDRVEAGVLGEYALGFGDGFFIHGTLYSRLLGRSVTHGCVRVGDDDLAKIYKKVPVGAKIYIH